MNADSKATLLNKAEKLRTELGQKWMRGEVSDADFDRLGAQLLAEEQALRDEPQTLNG
jgi:hypothetical protein